MERRKVIGSMSDPQVSKGHLNFEMRVMKHN